MKEGALVREEELGLDWLQSFRHLFAKSRQAQAGDAMSGVAWSLLRQGLWANTGPFVMRAHAARVLREPWCTHSVGPLTHVHPDAFTPSPRGNLWEREGEEGREGGCQGWVSVPFQSVPEWNIPFRSGRPPAAPVLHSPHTPNDMRYWVGIG